MNKSTQVKRKYNRVSSLIWALKKLWNLNYRFLIPIFGIVPVAVILPLLSSFFSKVLIDCIEGGASFSELILVVIVFVMSITILELFHKYMDAKMKGGRYYPCSVYQNEMSAMEKYETDYENTEKQDFRKIRGYAWSDACQGDCSLEFMANDLIKTLTDFAGIVTYASLLVLLNPVIFVVVAAVSLMSYATIRWQPSYYEKNKHHWEKEIRKKDYLSKLSTDFSRAKDIKLYGMEGWLDKMMQDYQAYIIMWNRRCSLRGLWAACLSGLMTLIQNATAYIVLIGIWVEGGISVGEFVFYFGLVSSIAGFLQGIIGDIAKLNTRADKIAYYREFFDYPSRHNLGIGCELPETPIKIEFKNVWYRYDGAEEDTLKGVNLTIEGGENLALVGLNGAGKTTLVKLLCGMYSPTRGEILVAGKKIEEYNIEEYYSMISAVFQNITPIAFSMFEFVASADLTRTTAREDAILAMKAAGIYEKIEHLEHGIDTHLMKGIYDDGVDLSGGEMQKLLLARAIYKNGSILVLDEPTSALDPIAENNLYLQYQTLTQGRTSLYISHRFASTRFCDRIVLLENGVITESGTHEQLMALNGQYAYMFGVQSKYYKEGESNE